MASASSITDVLILGGGHAGLAAALTLYRAQHTCLIFDSNRPRNSWASPTRSTPGWEAQDPERLREASRKELQQTGLARFVKCTIERLRKREDGLFEVTDTQGQYWVGRKLLIATGKEMAFPDIPGYSESFASGIFHCMFTFGYEQRGSSSAGLIAHDALAIPKHAAMVVDDTQKFADTVTVYTNSNATLAKEMRQVLHDRGVKVNDEKIIRLIKGNTRAEMTLEFANGETKIEDFLVHQPATKVNRILVDQLGLELDARGDIVVTPPFYQANVPGVFAAGDCASPFKIISNALFMGANAGAGLARELPKRVTGNSRKWDAEEPQRVPGPLANEQIVVA